jgi:hypothetical protein
MFKDRFLLMIMSGFAAAVHARETSKAETVKTDTAKTTNSGVPKAYNDAISLRKDLKKAAGSQKAMPKQSIDDALNKSKD